MYQTSQEIMRARTHLSALIEVPPKAPVMAISRLSASSPNILIVEDDSDIAGMLVDLMEASGFSAMSVSNAAEMDKCLARQKFDLLVLDGMLPGEDGFSVCRRIRASNPIAILMLTARREDIDRILGLELGADDYVTKPFNSRELVARIRSILRRSTTAQSENDAMDPLTFSGWRIDPRSRRVFDSDGDEVTMTAAEFDLLWAFCSHPNKVLTREQLLSMTHVGSAGPVERSVDAHISRLRQKIEPNLKEPSFIKTVRLGGYVFAANVEQAA